MLPCIGALQANQTPQAGNFNQVGAFKSCPNSKTVLRQQNLAQAPKAIPPWHKEGAAPLPSAAARQCRDTDGT